MEKGFRWQVPLAISDQMRERQIKILNSLKRKKETFVTKEEALVKWYCCGPTVYDVSHLGHARCYITFDIMRRILADYFGYKINYVMNITDIDDKIIKRARSNYLCDKYIENVLNNCDSLDKKLLDQLDEAINNYQQRRADEQDPAKKDMIHNIVERSKSALKALELNGSKLDKQSIAKILDKMRDVIADDQDVKLAHTVIDHQIFKALTLKYEDEYHQDMKSLNVLPPDSLPRVSEYIEQIGLYIKKIEANDYAYRSNGSIYFNTEKFDSNPQHSYAKLVREAYGHKRSLDEGEGELSTQDEKRSPSDFALWKKSKVGEPSWQTQDFEAGRPGWHIECSAMASDLLGECLDIHSGGYDLKFPHHDNEIAQAEAYYNTGKNWVNYFVHSGHLTISGCKMSKSLKNFITIRQALENYTSRHLRFAFLAHSWAETLDYSPTTMNTAVGYEKTFRKFFYNLGDVIRLRLSGQRDQQEASAGDFTAGDKELRAEFVSAIEKVDIALCDNFDTRPVLNALTSLVRECNRRSNASIDLLTGIAQYIKRMLSIFGAEFEFGQGTEHITTDLKTLQSFWYEVFEFAHKENHDSLSSLCNILKEKVSHDYQIKLDDSNVTGDTRIKVDVLARFRSDIRKIAQKERLVKILNLGDNLRDNILPSQGIVLEDKEEDSIIPFVVEYVDEKTLACEKALEDELKEEKRLRDEALRIEKLSLQQQREEKAKMPPGELFKGQTDKYSKFDEKGMPTHDTSGKEISKSALKKLQKIYAEQEARYNKYIGDAKK